MKRFLLLLPVLLVTACAQRLVQHDALFSSFEDFRPGPQGGVDLVWAAPTITSVAELQQRLNGYDKLALEQVWVVVDEDTGITTEQVDELTGYITEAIVAKLDGRFTLVDEVDDSTLRMSIALTNIETPNPILAVTSTVLPVGLGISTLSKVVTGEYTNVGGGTIELLVRDGKTGQPLIAAIDRRQGGKGLGAIIDSTDDVKDAIDWWVERLGQSFNN
ncbi:DUF3313 domain-containing protein [Ferrimonas sp. SCSIO 43195]|uniref:DUF3313 domain-containing protein n=1 Tax=Ferrimonas sp. SCSIO 43195 TaxID=2822844 RepID=UPI002075F650|nr:DUF3313 domain-containing protein [Ferrimonas sp. SCSIO 43195]USD38727.1 DUF3313 domain-containing protein [Ferrimonas sp. SCSIO 43195]